MVREEKDLAIVILIGGKSNRLGTEKGIMELMGKPLILHQIETFQKFDNDIFLIAHSEEQIYQYKKAISFPKTINFVIDDREIFAFQNLYKPMLGIYSGLKELDSLGFKHAFILSCDMPLIKPEVVELMIEKLGKYDCVIPRWDTGFLEYFFAIYPVQQGFKKAELILKTKNYGLVNFVDKSWNINYVSVEKFIKPLDPNLVSLININGPIDIYKVIKLFQTQ
ncbi:MAG: molybdenum cofactor guanylyltransferase [Candidatus Lokiarchaeota archaeon]|nr:molybdenum cofactor guanylyltransferase [Candidatus Lokiarchaeota archaeon]